LSRQHLRPPDPHPALVQHARERAALVQNRIADRITAYAGSMHFVYLHVLLFVRRLSKQILEFTNAIHALTVGGPGTKAPIADDAPTPGQPSTS
jgi:hypothetical protein